MRASAAMIVCAFIMAISARAGAQRDAAASAVPEGTALVAGVVITADGQQRPVTRAIVTLTSGELPGGRTAITDDEGRFAFERLPAARFSLSATKPSYLPAAYGAAKPGRAGIPLQLAAGQQSTGISLVMARGAAIAGALHDPEGEPVANTPVSAFRLPLPGGSQALSFVDSVTTDDRGVYRIFGLMPGDYLIAMTARAFNSKDISMPSTAQVDEALRMLQQRTGASHPAIVPPTPAASEPVTTVGYAPIFYPGTASVSAADKVHVDIGDERTDVNFVVQLTRMATISGALMAPGGGETGQVAFFINSDGVQLPGLVGNTPTFSATVVPTGRAFTYTNVTPGRYAITARTNGQPASWARAEIAVTGDDISGIAMVLQPSLGMTGRIVFDGAMPKPDVTKLRLNLSQTNDLGSSSSGSTNMGNPYVPPAIIDADGRFEITSILPDSYRFLTSVPGPSGWWLRSAIVGGVDVLDRVFTVGTTSMNDVVLTFSDRHTELSGTLLTKAGQPAPAYTIVAFPSDKTMWVPLARRIKSARAGTDGRWIIKDLPPGDYLVAALLDLDPDDLRDPSFFGTLASQSAPLTLGDGEQKTFDLRIGASTSLSTGASAPLTARAASPTSSWRADPARRSS